MSLRSTSAPCSTSLTLRSLTEYRWKFQSNVNINALENMHEPYVGGSGLRSLRGAVIKQPPLINQGSDSDETVNRGPMKIVQDKLLKNSSCDEAGG